MTGNLIRRSWILFSDMDLFAKCCCLFSFFLSWQIIGVKNTIIISDSIVIFLFFYLIYQKKLIKAPMTFLEKGLFLFLMIVSMTLAFHLNIVSIKEIIKFYYLVVATVVISRTIISSRQDNYKLMRQMMIALLLGAIVSVIFSPVVQYVFFPEMNLIDEKQSFPYFGHVFRLKGLAVQPGNLATVIILGFIYLWPGNFRNKAILLAISIIILAFTFSKAASLFLAVMLVLFVYKKVTAKQIVAPILICMGFLIFLTPVLFRPIVRGNQIPKAEKYLYSEKPIFKTKNLDIYASSYYYLKNAAKKLTQKHYLKGIGPGKFQSYIERMKKEGSFPRQISTYTPHDSYLGTFLEYGIIGAIAFSVLLIVVLKAYQQIEKVNMDFISIGACLLFIILHATMTDDHHLRHFWLILVFLNVSQLKESKSP